MNIQLNLPEGQISKYGIFTECRSQRECARLLQILELVREWIVADQYQADSARFRHSQFFGMTAG